MAIAKGEEYTLFKGLFDKVRKRDEQSQRILFEMFYRRVYDTAYFITQDRHLAQVVVQETFFKAFQRMDRLNDGEKMGAWLGAIATRTALDLLRKVKRWNDIATEDVYIEEEFSKNQSVPTVENIVEERFLKKILHQQIHELTPEYRQVIVLKYEYDLKDEEIAGKSPDVFFSS